MFSLNTNMSYRRWRTVIFPNTARVEGVSRASIPGASMDSVLLTVTASSRPLDKVMVLIFSWREETQGRSLKSDAAAGTITGTLTGAVRRILL